MLHDLKHAYRMLIHSKGWTIVVLLSLAIGIGATTALFTAVNEVVGVDRVVANIVTGIGFLGAGIIFREGGTVRGITTAATVWAVAAIGVAIGLELYLLALVATPLPGSADPAA